jgi:hypothetical protein
VEEGPAVPQQRGLLVKNRRTLLREAEERKSSSMSLCFRPEMMKHLGILIDGGLIDLQKDPSPTPQKAT